MKSQQSLQTDLYQEPSPLKNPPDEPGDQRLDRSSASSGVSRGKSVTGGADSWYDAHSLQDKFEEVTGFRTYQATFMEKQVSVKAPPRKRKSRKAMPKRKKGDIQRFSHKSRRRLFRKFNAIQVSLLGEPIFVTCTARPECFDVRPVEMDPQDSTPVYAYLFQKRFLPGLREAIPNLVYIWRLEPHQSGEAHYHLVCWSFDRDRNLDSEFYKRKIRKAWRESIDDHSRSAELYSCKIKKVENEQHCFHYVNKYCAKEETLETERLKGRRWASSDGLPTAPITEKRISPEEREHIRELAIHLLSQRKKPNESYIEHIRSAGSFVVMLSTEEMKTLSIHFENGTYPASHEKAGLQSGSDPPEGEFWDPEPLLAPLEDLGGLL